MIYFVNGNNKNIDVRNNIITFKTNKTDEPANINIFDNIKKCINDFSKLNISKNEAIAYFNFANLKLNDYIIVVYDISSYDEFININDDNYFEKINDIYVTIYKLCDCNYSNEILNKIKNNISIEFYQYEFNISANYIMTDKLEFIINNNIIEFDNFIKVLNKNIIIPNTINMLNKEIVLE